MGHAPNPIVLGDTRGGRNGTDPPMSLPLNQVVEAVNIDWKDSTLGHKRGGSIAVSQSGGTAFTLGIQEMGRHVPGSAETAAELWATDGAATPIVKRLTGGVTWADVTLDDAIATRPQDVVGVTLNGKRFMAYDSTVDRVHVYDPGLASPRVRRVGLITPAAPTAANSAVAGAYAAVLRYYRVRWLQLTGTTVTRRSEPSASVAFTPSGAFDAVIITKPTNAGEGETHWEIEVSTDNATFYVLYGVGGPVAAIAIATTTAGDPTATTSYPTFRLSEFAGTFALFPSVKYLLSDGNRLLGIGAWETAGATSGGKNSRVWFTPVLGSTDHGDDERVPNTTSQKNWVDLNENDGGGGTGLGGPLDGVPWAFKYRQVWKLRPTGDVATPYLPRKVRDDIGCISHKTIALGEDQIGRGALYFLSHKGPYRVTADDGVQYLGRDNEDLWRTMNLGATTLVGHSVYYPDLHQWWVCIATGSSNTPNLRLMFDVQLGFPDEHNQIRGGWAQNTIGDAATAISSCLFSNTLGASMSRDLKPHLGLTAGPVILKCDTADLTDNGAPYQAYETSRPILTTKDLAHKVGISESTLVAKVQTGVTITVTINRDFGKETRAAAVLLTAAGTETRVVKKVEGLEMGEADVVQMTIGDASALSSTWSLDALIIPVTPQETR